VERKMALPESDAEMLLLHNPRCSKSRATLALLEERAVTFDVREYLSEPLSRAELASLGDRLGRPPGEWIRNREAAFAEAGLSADSSEAALLDTIAEHPILMERPVLVSAENAAIGRPPENVLELL
jgi:arsenate reductase